MKFIEHLSKDEIRKFNQLRRSAEEKQEAKPSKPVIKKKIIAAMSRREVEELMGTRRDTYKRVNGAVRRK
ncbi:hypothetical protein [Bacillus sp. JJ1474]|uniref:hypothetical protein n=1 Tax=Bacillus sp. JJ1474 TaxID=3122955 RepID=UPI002FFFCDF4